MSQQPEVSEELMSEQSVADYLRRNPDFFQRHDYLLPELELPHPGAGSAVSLIERQVAVLRDQRHELKRKLLQLTQTARDNEHLLERIERLILELLSAPSGDELLLRLRHGLREDFHADAVELRWLDGDAQETAMRKLFDKVITRNEPVCGHIAAAQAQLLFSKAADEMASGAVIPLFSPRDGHCVALLGIGSVDPRRFHAEMGTTFLRYLGAVLARLLARRR